jgi:hypothetical protein
MYPSETPVPMYREVKGNKSIPRNHLFCLFIRLIRPIRHILALTTILHKNYEATGNPGQIYYENLKALK